MAKLVMFTLCDSFDNRLSGDNNVTSLVAPQIALRPPYIPGTFSFGVAGGIAGVDLHTDLHLQIKIFDPSGVEISTINHDFNVISAAEDTMPPEYQGFIFFIDIRNQLFNGEGEYTFSVLLNGESIGEKKVPIFKGRV